MHMCGAEYKDMCGPARLKPAGWSAGDSAPKCETRHSINGRISENRMALCVLTSQVSPVTTSEYSNRAYSLPARPCVRGGALKSHSL